MPESNQVSQFQLVRQSMKEFTDVLTKALGENNAAVLKELQRLETMIEERTAAPAASAGPAALAAPAEAVSPSAPRATAQPPAKSKVSKAYAHNPNSVFRVSPPFTLFS